ncbi:unnamed protein product [Clonostachys rosea f. rosea IK726]|uniref:Uncharacterized protein n=1 Tax=Clonostachys rosea f. rosea IK726 TaxID=1349383 RepID=A0ACA9UQ16_BIOOC|nr:unnamed protein product [Clonostachys rosea f. rosea IK726]
MPSFFIKKKTKASHEEDGANDERASTPPPIYDKSGHSQDAPPSFDVATASAQGTSPTDHLTSLMASFANLRLETQKDPDVDTCIAHLRFIHAIQNLKEEIGYHDGLWNLWDSRAGPVGALEDGELNEAQIADIKTKLSHLREKRWALYVARAVDRYQLWWQAIAGDRLMAKEVHDKGSPRWVEFPNGTTDFSWTEDQLPPLADVLMIWHTHMLNPRCYLEDAMLWGQRELWTTGMPWAVLNKALDPKMAYSPSSECRMNWETLTGVKWENELGATTKIVDCPACKQPNDVAWTTCGLPETYKGVADPGLTGNGYGDGDFKQTCTECGIVVTKSLLFVANLVRDTKKYVENDITMPGSVLHPESGMPPTPDQIADVILPNHLAKQALESQLDSFIDSSMENLPSMLTIKDLFSKILSTEQGVSSIRDPNAQAAASASPSNGARPRLKSSEAVQIRKMMSRYWENHSIFALDLVAAVMRQGTFIEKAVRLNWLFSPVLRQSMDRFCQKYQRFLLIMHEDSMHLCVPTLDVDLVWHTHQLAPRAYYKSTTTHSGKLALRKPKFVDHNDKVEESTLARSFERTSATYLAKFGEVYSECACGFCEAIHHKNSFPKGPSLFSVGKNKVQKAIHDFQNAQPPPPSEGTAHISAHNASEQPPTRAYIGEYIRKAWELKLDESYDRAVKRAGKKGRKLPSKGEYYSHWGRKYFIYGPQSAPTFLSDKMYSGSSPSSMVSPGADPAWATCAIGACGQNDIAAGGCGGPGGCVQWGNNALGNHGILTGGIGTVAGGAGGCGGGGG